MAQHDYSIANQSGASFRQDLNNALSAAVTLNSGATSPSTTFAYQLWADTTAGLLKIRNAANNAWITLRQFDGTLNIQGGSAGSPGLTFTGDTNTGFFSANADELAIATAGLQRLLVDSSGRLLVGPGTAGRAVGGAVVAQLNIETLGQALALVRNSADTSGAIIALGKSRATTAGGVTAVVDGDILGELRFCGANGTDMSSIGAHIRAIVTGEVGTAGDLTDMPASLVFSTTPDGEATAAEAMRIDPGKRVLVGTTDAVTTTAGHQLQGVSTSGFNVILARDDSTTAAEDLLGGIRFYGNDGGSYEQCASITAVADLDHAAGDKPTRLSFSTTIDGGSGPGERFRIANDGSMSAVIPGGSTLYPASMCRAWVNFNGTTNTNLSGTYSQSGTTVTVTATAHGLIAGNTVYSDITSGTAVDGTYTVATVTDANTFTYTAGTSLTTSGNITLIRNTIRASYNVSSITDNATGDYTVNFTTAMADANYASCFGLGNPPTNNFAYGFGASNFTTTTTSHRFQTVASTSNLIDLSQVHMSYFR